MSLFSVWNRGSESPGKESCCHDYFVCRCLLFVAIRRLLTILRRRQRLLSTSFFLFECRRSAYGWPTTTTKVRTKVTLESRGSLSGFRVSIRGWRTLCRCDVVTALCGWMWFAFASLSSNSYSLEKGLTCFYTSRETYRAAFGMSSMLRNTFGISLNMLFVARTVWGIAAHQRFVLQYSGRI